ncbi:hypothetical protein COV18_06835 [Candidatus Woesearchaeota archaeon CG10_big_fil_rev_8_21_14_0_10_37_12]|nr:MAG: hypothetical protein COV18_06835 [Candidatus Woesearchaeota archaeon CG10_big_fil_rev_8_21_14_0_10_37_12]
MEIIPGILVHSLEELKQTLKKLSWAKKIHIDIMDGKFVPNQTIQLAELKKINPKQNMQIHLMAHKPETYVKGFAKLGVKEFIYHAETSKQNKILIEKIKKTGMKAGIAFNPETTINKFKNAIKEAELALIMTIHPGFSGQKLIKKPLAKIKQIKTINQNISVGIDGGFNLTNCNLVKTSETDFAIATSAITKQKKSKEAYTKLRKKSN